MELRKEAVSVTIHVIVFGIRARQQGRRWIRGQWIVVAGPFFRTTGDFKCVANAVPIRVDITIAVTVVQSIGVEVNCVNAQIVVDELCIWIEVAGVLDKAVAFTDAIEDDVHVVVDHT